MKIKDRIAAMMYGRYGADQLYKFLSVFSLCLIVIDLIMAMIFGNNAFTLLLQLVVLAVLVFMIYRFMSKNFEKRRKENDAYLRAKAKVSKWHSLNVRRFKERKTHSFKKCPHCKGTVRLKKVPGKHTARCPICSNTFEVKF